MRSPFVVAASPASAAWAGWVGTVETVVTTSGQGFSSHKRTFVRVTDPGPRDDASIGTGTGQYNAVSTFFAVLPCQLISSTYVGAGALFTDGPAFPLGITVTESPGGYTVQGLSTAWIQVQLTDRRIPPPPQPFPPCEPERVTTMNVFLPIGPIFVPKPLAEPGHLELTKATPRTDGGSETVTVDLFQDPATIQVVKDLEPDDDPGRFKLLIDDVVENGQAGDGESTQARQVSAGTHTVSEESAENEDGVMTRLADYDKQITCVDQDGQIGVGTTASLSFTADPNDTIVCTIKNTFIGTDEPCDTHFSEAESVADIALPGPIPDLGLAKFEATVNWCSNSHEVKVHSAAPFDTPNMNTIGGTAFGTLAHTLGIEVAPDQRTRFLSPCRGPWPVQRMLRRSRRS